MFPYALHKYEQMVTEKPIPRKVQGITDKELSYRRWASPILTGIAFSILQVRHRHISAEVIEPTRVAV